jgi:hypothetical protein
MACVSQPSADAYRAGRQRLLAGVSARLREAGIGATFEPLERYCDFYGSLPDGLTGLVVRATAGGARMQVTVVSARRIVPPGEGGLSGDGRSWVRDLDVSYDLDVSGDIVFEVTTIEDPDAGLGHSRATSAMRRLTRDDQAVVDAVRLWHGYRESLRCVPPAPHPDRARARRIRQIAARRSAAAVSQVRWTAAAYAVAPQQRPALAAHLAQLDHSQLCYHFPRDPNGRYAKRAVVALAGYGAGLGKRGPWLAVRADGNALVAGVEELIGDNQDHRWDNSPWLWNITHRNAGAGQRWQLPGAAYARPIVTLLDQHAVAEALTVAGVDVDTDIAALLAGYPTCYLRAEHTDTWVNRLYGQLQNSAPWRFAAAYRIWQRERQTASRRVSRPIALFGLRGLNQQRKPMVALELRDGTPCLLMVWSGSNSRLPRTLWERPADLEATLLADSTS